MVKVEVVEEADPETPEVMEPEDTAEFQRALDIAKNVYVTFRKYQGRTLAHVLQTEPSYVEWMRRKLVESCDEAGMKLLVNINKLYNDFPCVQEIVYKSLQAYYDSANKAHVVPASTSLADNPQLKSLCVLEPVPAPKEPRNGLALDGLTLKQVVAMRDEHAKEKEALREEQSAIDQRRSLITSRLSHLHTELAQLEQKVEELTPKLPAVTDHALVRYFERVMGMDIEQMKRQVIGSDDPELLQTYQTSSSGRYMVSNTHRVHLENNVIVTVLPR
ncbi:hypothetical protein AUC43_15240 [Hymenobacter sedentarius]|uniref:Uncharacterized protein n=1 Tax=Hymenobacter sedentarius TaxID=1411621 RepID=A0A0U4AZX0_9BACT|nr:hypothetical protein AUC43_15240 [Hymenobacter sedentarius]